jgi:hypothetical protein
MDYWGEKSLRSIPATAFQQDVLGSDCWFFTDLEQDLYTLCYCRTSGKFWLPDVQEMVEEAMD